MCFGIVICILLLSFLLQFAPTLRADLKPSALDFFVVSARLSSFATQTALPPELPRAHLILLSVPPWFQFHTPLNEINSLQRYAVSSKAWIAFMATILSCSMPGIVLNISSIASSSSFVDAPTMAARASRSFRIGCFSQTLIWSVNTFALCGGVPSG